MAIDHQKYVELSLAGKWITIGRAVIQDNPGMSRSDAVALVARYMPDHICRRNAKQGKVSLAVDSVKRSNAVEIDGKLYPEARKSRPGPSADIVKFAIENGIVSSKDCKHIKHFHKLAQLQVDRGVLVKVNPGVYAIAEVQQ